MGTHLAPAVKWAIVQSGSFAVNVGTVFGLGFIRSVFHSRARLPGSRGCARRAPLATRPGRILLPILQPLCRLLPSSAPKSPWIWTHGGGTLWVPRLVGLGRAMEYLLLGTRIDAALAREVGLANRVVEPEAIAAETAALAAQLSKGVGGTAYGEGHRSPWSGWIVLPGRSRIALFATFQAR